MKKHEKKVRKKHRKVLFGALLCLAVIVLVPVLCYGIVHISQRGQAVHIEHIESLAEKDAVIVPGASSADGSISAKGKDRLQAAIKLYQAGLVRQIIVSGGKKEVTPMANYLMRKEIPSDVLVSDDYGIDTYDTIARAKEKFGDLSFYFCTQELYSSRSGYLMDRLGMDGAVVCVDAKYYGKVGKNMVREFFAATKAVLEPVVLFGKAKSSVAEEEFSEVKEPLKNSHFVYAEDLEIPKDCQITDTNPDDDYDVQKAVAYARTYAFENNPSYGQFENNCTNFVSQCLVAGGIDMEGEPEISEKTRWNISDRDTDWYSSSEICKSDGLTHYSMSQTFVKTDAFFAYFTEKRGYELTLYQNNHEGNKKCYEEMAAGDVLVLYNKDGAVVHLGLISGIGDKNAYYCGNTAERRDFSVFTINKETYSKIGILHMSE